MPAIRYPPTFTMSSQICCSSSCSLPACASAWLHALSRGKARFSRRSSLLISLSRGDDCDDIEVCDAIDDCEVLSEGDSPSLDGVVGGAAWDSAPRPFFFPGFA